MSRRGRPVITWGPAAELRRARYSWAASQGLNHKAANGCQTFRGLCAAFPDRDIPPELLERSRVQGRYLIGPRTFVSHQRSMRYTALRAAGADRFQASDGSLTDAAFARVMKELRRG